MNSRLNKDFFIKAFIRAAKTFFQTLASMIVIGSAFSENDWARAFSVAGVAAFLSLCTSFGGGLPEAGTDGKLVLNDSGDDKDIYSFELNDEPEKLMNKKVVSFSVVKK